MGLFSKDLDPDEYPATIYWDTGQEDDITVHFESGLFYNHDKTIAIADMDTVRVNTYRFNKPGQAADHIGETIELRHDPEPLEYVFQPRIPSTNSS